ncbi:fimbrial protein [Rouxiella sp. Mn2063]|uniref:fimbrial protein n=1 Tax=Rouxiella sp. Mn2063 TaxID=3395262 RepID=UPI003BC2114C
MANNLLCPTRSKICTWVTVFVSVAIGLVPQQLYAVQGNKIAVSVTIVAKPCKINDGQIISIDFGNDVMTTKVDVSSVAAPYKKIPINYTITGCKGSSALKMTISGDAPIFDGQLLKTDNKHLAIKIMKEDGQIFPINTPLKFTYPNTPKLFAAPIKRQGSTLVGMIFSASATMKVEYQ